MQFMNTSNKNRILSYIYTLLDPVWGENFNSLLYPLTKICRKGAERDQFKYWIHMIPYGLPLANKQVSPSLWIEKNYYTEAFHWIERRRWLFKNTLILGDGTWIHLSQEIGLGYIYPRRWDLDTSIPGDGTWIHLSQEMGLEGYIYPRRWDLKDTSIPEDGTWRIHLSQIMGLEGYRYI